MEIFIGTDTAKVELLFNIFTTEFETFVMHTVGPRFVSCVWDWNHSDNHLGFSVILKTLTLTGQGFLEA